MMTAPDPGPRAPLISVIVPVYNVADHVGACIDSLRAQTLADFEVIVIDDGATDDSAARARAAAGKDARFRFVAQENRGLSGARNTGLALARGEFIAFVDSDDRVSPDYLARLHGALEDSGADWVACAIAFVRSDAPVTTHSAIHGAPDLACHPGLRRYRLDDWAAVLRHFPSAWNKLYRRALIDGLTFDEGTWYEDHAFFCRAASRTDHILHLPEPLYLQTRGRAGQITGEDSERVFEQLSVLERLRDIFAAAPKTGWRDGFARIATRLVYERSEVLADRARRARFAAACAAFFARHDLTWSPGGAPEGIGLAWGLAMAGTLPLSIVIAATGGDAAALTRSLEALEAQVMRDYEVLVVRLAGPADSAGSSAGSSARPAGPARPGLQEAVARWPGARLLAPAARGRAAARNRGRAAARGEFVIFADPGDLYAPQTLRVWTDGMLRHQADFGFSGFEQGTWEAGHYRNGFLDTRGLEDRLAAARAAGGPFALTPHDALCLDPQPCAKIFRRGFLETRVPGFVPGPLSEQQMLLTAAIGAEQGVYFAFPGVVHPPGGLSRRDSPGALARALRPMAASLPAGADLPAGWQRRLYARAIRAGLQARARRPGPRLTAWLSVLWFALRAALAVRLHGLSRQSGPLDPDIGPHLRTILGGPRGG